MFSVDELGLIAYLNDNALPATNRGILASTSDTVNKALDRFLSKGNAPGPGFDAPVVDLLNDRRIGREALARTTGRVRDYLGSGIGIVTYWDSTYPGNLRSIQDPPLVLYVHGKALHGSDQVAILGTSTPSERGLDLAYEYGARFAKKGRTVVSSLTRGIDAQALEGALSVGGVSMAVLGTPLTGIYPEESKAMASEVARNGAVVSELTEEAYLHPGRSLRRNRLVAGISGSVVIVESTGIGAVPRLVEQALRQGRRAYVIDQGEFDDPDHEVGFKRLKDLGAIPITHADDILSHEARQERLF